MDLHVVEDLALLGRLVVAAVLGAALGWEREEKGKAAGLRTHILVSVSACFFVLLGDIAPVVAQEVTSDLRMDPVRIIQAVVIGIGFIGSGVVQAARGEHHGLTTAASIWGTAAVGIAVGFRHWTLAVGATLLVLFVLRVLGRLEHRVERAP